MVGGRSGEAPSRPSTRRGAGGGVERFPDGSRWCRLGACASRDPSHLGAGPLPRTSRSPGPSTSARTGRPRSRVP
ncbi:hypothetical protein FTX61_06055 [Nitriliruptoraceae bacterium ZYF776]|nr:hypothetical protein [Profundirhabdus halotolerans]